MQKKKLRGITPYNDCWFRTCYYHQLIAALSYFGVPTEYTLMNYMIKVADFISWKDFSYEEKSILSDYEFDELTGIERKKYVAENVTDTVVKCINRKHPVIVGQDNFYLPYRPVYFNKMHCSHFVLCCGYDKINDTVTIFEQDFVSCCDFRPREVSVADLQLAYKGFTEQYPEFGWSVTEMRVAPVKKPFKQRVELIEKMCAKKRESDFVLLVKPYVSFTNLQWEDIDAAIDYCVFFTKHSRVCIKLYELFSGRRDITDKIEKLWQHAQFVQGLMAKARYLKDVKILNTDLLKRRVLEMQDTAAHLDKEIFSL